MANKKRIRLMTRLAIMESHRKKELENALRLTLAFGLGFLLWACCNMDSIMKKLNTLDVRGMTAGICAAYLLCMTVGLVITYIIAGKRYFQGQKELQQYHIMLERLEPEEKQD